MIGNLRVNMMSADGDGDPPRGLLPWWCVPRTCLMWQADSNVCRLLTRDARCVFNKMMYNVVLQVCVATL